ncbi:MAG: amino acid permease [Kiritimatiellia bacterium]|jgi:amino acid transporter/mannitol/fructose-specific phosphotransferase system IIA component (Ntr-type)|nr:amino acid permease [Kiritimatiellia bacterium]MDP6847697.1 amino acid permease [Kiritimatiellia bacterium]
MKLKKSLGFLDVFAISSGAMISSGLFLLPGIIAAKVGPSAVLVYVLSGILFLPSLLSKAELSTAMPRAGGTYFFITRSLGSMFGTIDGLGGWLALIFKTSIALVGLGAYLSMYVGIPMPVIASVGCVFFLFVNMQGGRHSGTLQVAMVAGLIGILMYFIIKGIPRVDMGNFTPFAPKGMESILPATGMVFVSYIGLTKVASVAEEVRNPERNIPYGMMAALFSVMVIYALGVWVTVGVLPAEELHVSLTPLADAGRKIIGPVGTLLLCSAAILAFATTANAGLMAASRYLLAMGRDRVIPHNFARLSKTKMPRNALYLTSALVLLIVLVVDIEGIAKLASTFQLLAFALINIGVIVMRESGIESYDPGFKSPLYPYMQIAGVTVSVVLIPEMGLMSSLFAMGLVGVGVVWYNLYVRHRIPRVGAVAKVAERIAESLLHRDAQALGLEHELREILKEKGLRRGDPFVQMVRKAEFIEIGDRADCEDVLRHGATIIAERANISSDLILGGLLQRSRLGETPAEAGIALPHLLMDEVEDFHLVIARSIHGIDFPMANQAIHAVFILLGNRKDPSQHLRFLAEIARRAEIPRFIDRWVDADSEEELRELLLSAPDDIAEM